MSTISLTKAVAALTMVTAMAVPTMAAPQSHRQQTKNTWRNLGIAGGALGVAGLATHNKTLAVAGLAGGAYSAVRYEHDRRSQSQHRSHYRHHYTRHHSSYHHHR